MKPLQASQYAQYEDLSSGRIGRAPAPTAFRNAPSRIHAEMHLGVYGALLGCWAAFFSLFWITFFSSSQTDFLMGFILVFAIVGFGLLAILDRTGKYLPGTQGDLRDFLKERVATIDGSVTGAEALIQVVLVPACLTVGGAAIALIVSASRFSY